MTLLNTKVVLFWPKKEKPGEYFAPFPSCQTTSPCRLTLHWGWRQRGRGWNKDVLLCFRQHQRLLTPIGVLVRVLLRLFGRVLLGKSFSKGLRKGWNKDVLSAAVLSPAAALAPPDPTLPRVMGLPVQATELHHHPTSTIEHQALSIKHTASSIEHQASSQYETSSIKD